MTLWLHYVETRLLVSKIIQPDPIDSISFGGIFLGQHIDQRKKREWNHRSHRNRNDSNNHHTTHSITTGPIQHALASQPDAFMKRAISTVSRGPRINDQKRRLGKAVSGFCLINNVSKAITEISFVRIKF